MGVTKGGGKGGEEKGEKKGEIQGEKGVFQSEIPPVGEPAPAFFPFASFGYCKRATFMKMGGATKNVLF